MAKTTAEKIAVMQAFEEGKQIQAFDNTYTGEWVDMDYPAWNWTKRNYRVKPEPEEIYVVYTSDGVFSCVRLTEEAAKRTFTVQDVGGYYKKFREVIEE